MGGGEKSKLSEGNRTGVRFNCHGQSPEGHWNISGGSACPMSWGGSVWVRPRGVSALVEQTTRGTGA